MFVFNDNEQGILFITIYYQSVPVMAFIYNTTVIFLWGLMRFNGILLKSYPVLNNGMGIGKESISLLLNCRL
jgi:hypothetical protein